MTAVNINIIAAGLLLPVLGTREQPRGLQGLGGLGPRPHRHLPGRPGPGQPPQVSAATRRGVQTRAANDPSVFTIHNHREGSVHNSATFPMLLLKSSKKVVILNEISRK